MQEENLIPAKEFCAYHNIEVSFLHSLQEYGLVEITHKDVDTFIDTNQLLELEKLLRLHYELNINLEGLDAINNLLNRLEEVQNEIITLKNKLRFYEDMDHTSSF